MDIQYGSPSFAHLWALNGARDEELVVLLSLLEPERTRHQFVGYVRLFIAASSLVIGDRCR